MSFKKKKHFTKSVEYKIPKEISLLLFLCFFNIALKKFLLFYRTD